MFCPRLSRMNVRAPRRRASVAVGEIMCAVALTASLVPLLRVLRADPVRALWAE